MELRSHAARWSGASELKRVKELPSFAPTPLLCAGLLLGSPWCYLPPLPIRNAPKLLPALPS